MSTSPSHATPPPALAVELVPYARDNYAYLLHPRGHTGATRGAIVVDPGDAAAVLAALSRHRLEAVAIWCTHHHHDHVGGLEPLLAEVGPVPVLGSRYDLDAGRIPGQTLGLEDGAALDAFGQPFRALLTPGHTLGAVVYAGEGMAFTGDTLFLGGCGRVFEGTMAMMHASLGRIAQLPDATRLYVGHEYTESNLRFAAHVEPESEAVASRLAAVRAQRERGEPTVPGTLEEERRTNPFLRAHEAAVARFAEREGGPSGGGITSEIDIFAQVRGAKDAF